MAGTILILGSAPDAVEAMEFDGAGFRAIVAINNAWRIRKDWTHLVHAGDFPADRMPLFTERRQQILSYEAYVPANNMFGGIVYAGGTMAFTAAYWALANLRPDMIVFRGCDMVYERAGDTHFYGNGAADPLRVDPTLQSLEAKSNRLLAIAAKHFCLCANASRLRSSRLTFPRIDMQLNNLTFAEYRKKTLATLQRNANIAALDHALALEAEKQQFVSTGDYWNYPESIDAVTLSNIDTAWLAVFADETSQCKTLAG